MVNYNEGQLHTNKKSRRKNFSFISLTKYIIIFSVLSYILSNMGAAKSEDTTQQLSYLKLLASEDELEKIIEDLEKKFNIKIEDSKKDEFLLLNAININEHLNEKEKNIFYGYHSIIEDCLYMNREEAYESLSKVNIKYKERGEGIKKTTLGDYSYIDKKINIYEDDEENSVLIHEGIHCMFFYNQTEDLPKHFTEGVTELLTKEYFSTDPFFIQKKYPYEVAYVKMLCELVGSDLVLKAYCIGDFSLITDYMDEYNHTGISSKDLLQQYEEALQKIEDKSNLALSIDKKILLTSLDRIYQEIHPDLNEYENYKYMSRFSINIYENDPMKYYYDFLNENGVLEKGYFCKELQKEYSTVILKSIPKRDKVLTRI